jgi:hypothetical protein
MDERDVSSTRLLGLSLAQYAGIQAAVALRFPLERALANERLSTKKWDRCRTAWGAKLAREGRGSPLSAAFRDKQAEATAWLGRRISPLDEDLAAWVGFLGAYASEPAPSALLARLGLRDDDVQRLVLAWKRRTDADEALAKKALDLAKKAPRVVPVVKVTPGELRPFPWSPGPLQVAQPVSRGSKEDPRRDIPREPETPARPVAIETPSFLLAGAAPSAPAAVAPLGALEPPPAPAPPIGETVLGFVLPSATKALPFSPSAEDAPAALAESPRAPMPQSGETAVVFELPRALLPFGAAAPVAAKTGAPEARTPETGTSETGTLPVFVLPTMQELPFGTSGATSSAEATSSGPGSPATPAKHGEPLSTGTVLAPDPPEGPALPFRSSGADPVSDRIEGNDLAAIVRAVRARKPEPAAARAGSVPAHTGPKNRARRGWPPRADTGAARLAVRRAGVSAGPGSGGAGPLRRHERGEAPSGRALQERHRTEKCVGNGLSHVFRVALGRRGKQALRRDRTVSTPESPEDIRREIRLFEVKIMALRREKEELLLALQRKPWWFRIVHGLAVVLGVLLRIAALVSVLVIVLFLAMALRWRPR